MSIKLITPPSELAVTLAEARFKCKISATSNVDYEAMVDAELTREIKSLMRVCMQKTGRSIMPQTLQLSLDTFPPNQDIELFYPNILSIESFTYVDAETGATTALSTDQYYLDDAREYEAWLLLAADMDSWPATKNVAEAVKVQYRAGYENAAAVPDEIKAWLLSALKFLYDGGFNGLGELPRDYHAALLDAVSIPRV